MISFQLNNRLRADIQQDCSFGNILFMIAGTIGIAMKNGYSYGFNSWPNQDFFVNPLPPIENINFSTYQMPSTFKGWDLGFCGFNVPDNSMLIGQFPSEKYFKHCEDLIRYYFTMKDLCEPYKDCILIHYRAYAEAFKPLWAQLDQTYYLEALKQFSDRKVIVVTDNIKEAKDVIKEDFEYVSNSPIIDFYLLSHADYIIMGNSTFSWWGAWLSKAKTVAPLKWYDGDYKDAPIKDLYCPEWILI